MMRTMNAALALSVLALLVGCGSAEVQPTKDVVGSKDEYVSTRRNQILRHMENYTQRMYEAEGDIDALANYGDRLMWAEDESVLHIGSISGEEFSSRPLKTLTHDIDGLCFAPLEDGLFEVFISDGDGHMYQYWLLEEISALSPVRTLSTNPGIERCVVDGESLVLDDPFFGQIVAARNPENDAVFKPYTDADLDARFATLREGRHPLKAPEESPSAKFSEVYASLETEPVDSEGAADAVVLAAGDGTWWIVGADKQQGLRVYDAQGKQQHFMPEGGLNNVDALPLKDAQFLLVASHRSESAIDVFVADLAANTVALKGRIGLELDDPHGLCMGRGPKEELWVFVGDSSGRVEHWQLGETYRDAEKLAAFSFDSQAGGCVYYADSQQLYVGETDRGIWRIDLESGDKTLVEDMAAGHLVAEVAGLDIYRDKDQSWLIASSQGDDSYVVYQLEPWQFVARFRIGPDYHRVIDGASATEGLAVSAAALPDYPKGVLVVQDGRNRAPEAAQNFKVVDWRKIAELLEPGDD
ncbi:MAG: phytase [Spongiibacter sp.]|nr:phytase [Spongiibacter sp.]